MLSPKQIQILQKIQRSNQRMVRIYNSNTDVRYLEQLGYLECVFQKNLKGEEFAECVIRDEEMTI